MARHVDDEAAGHLADLVDAIGELVAAILDMHTGIGVSDVAPVHIGNARHEQPSRKFPVFLCDSTAAVTRNCVGHDWLGCQTPSDFSLRCSAERSMPMNSAVFEMLPPKRLIWAIR